MTNILTPRHTNSANTAKMHQFSKECDSFDRYRGTHVRNTAEIGAVAVTDIEKKGKQNRRVRIALT